MDILTQGLLGAATAQAAAPKPKARSWALLGAAGGLAPDLDVLIRSSSDPLLFLDYHRHFTHALAFIPLGSAFVALVVSLLFKKLKFKEVYLPALLGYATHGLLDACTSYGTFLLWPFSSERIAWNSISIVDPLFTFLLITGIILTTFGSRMRWVRGALAVALCYLAFGFMQHNKAAEIQYTLAQSRGHSLEGGRVKPSFGTNILFRSYYRYDGYYYVDAIRLPWWGSAAIYPGERVEVLETSEFLERHPLSSVQAEDLIRFEKFSSGYLVAHPNHPQVIGDLRYSFLPNSVAPLWGIQWSIKPSSEHTPFLNFREASAGVRKEYWNMLIGNYNSN